MEIEKKELLRVLNSVMFNTRDLIDQIIKYDTEINDKDISDAKRALKNLLRGLDILEGLLWLCMVGILLLLLATAP